MYPLDQRTTILDSIWDLNGTRIEVWNGQRRILNAIATGNNSRTRIITFLKKYYNYNVEKYSLYECFDRMLDKKLIFHFASGQFAINKNLKLIEDIHKLRRVPHDMTNLDTLLITLLDHSPSGVTIDTIQFIISAPRFMIINKLNEYINNGIATIDDSGVYRSGKLSKVSSAPNKTTDQLPNETNERTWPVNCLASECYVCKEKFKEGDKVYITKNNIFNGRHTTCARSAKFKKYH